MGQLAGHWLSPQAYEATKRWRVGRKVGRTIYMVLGEDASDADPLIGVMDSPEIAAAAVDAHNATLPSRGGAA